MLNQSKFQILSNCVQWAIAEKNQTGVYVCVCVCVWGGGGGYGISRGIKEIECGISRGYIKTKWNFQRWPRKNNVEFRGVSVFGLGISKGSNIIL